MAVLGHATAFSRAHTPKFCQSHNESPLSSQRFKQESTWAPTTTTHRPQRSIDLLFQAGVNGINKVASSKRPLSTDDTSPRTSPHAAHTHAGDLLLSSLNRYDTWRLSFPSLPAHIYLLTFVYHLAYQPTTVYHDTRSSAALISITALLASTATARTPHV